MSKLANEIFEYFKRSWPFLLTDKRYLNWVLTPKRNAHHLVCVSFWRNQGLTDLKNERRTNEHMQGLDRATSFISC